MPYIHDVSIKLIALSIDQKEKETLKRVSSAEDTNKNVWDDKKNTTKKKSKTCEHSFFRQGTGNIDKHYK